MSSPGQPSGRALDPQQRAQALACDRALVGLDPAEEMELASLLEATDDLPLRLERAAAAVALSELVLDEPLPAHLADAVAAAAGAALGARGRGGTLPMTPAAMRSDARTAVMMPGAAMPGAAMPGAAMPGAAMEAGRPGLKQASSRGVGAAELRRIGTGASDGAAPARRSPTAWLGWLAAAACLALAIGSLVWRRGTLEGEVVATAPSAVERRDRLVTEASDVVRRPWTATADPAGKGESGEVVWSTSRQEGYMTFRGLAPNDPRKEQYQLWIFDGARDERYPVDGGVFDVGPGGEVVVPITARVAVAKPVLFAVTVEPPGGVVVSKRERIVVTADG